MNLIDLVGPVPFEKFKNDVALFVTTFDSKTPWDYQIEMMHEVTERENGKFKRRVGIISTPRQNGKTLMSVWIALWRLFTDPTCEQIISVGLDRAGARLLLNDARRIIRDNAILSDLIDKDWGLTKNTIRLANGQEWIIRSSEAVRARGLRPAHCAIDELGWHDTAEMFQVLSSAQAAQDDPLMIISSTVSAVQAGPLWDLFQSHDRGDGDITLCYTNENESPKISKNFLDGQRERLPNFVYLREHENKWSSGSEAFCTPEDYARATQTDPTLYEFDGDAWMYCDIGLVHDESAFAVSRLADNGIREIIWLEAHRGSKDEPLSLEMLGSRMLSVGKKLNVNLYQVESPQGGHLAERLRGVGVQADVVYPSTKHNSQRWMNLFELLRAGAIRIPPDDVLRRQLLSLLLRQTAQGFKTIETDKRLHQDRAVAVAGAALMTGDAPFDWQGQPEGMSVYKEPSWNPNRLVKPGVGTSMSTGNAESPWSVTSAEKIPARFTKGKLP